MSRLSLRSLSVAGALLVAVALPAAAQQRPTADQARALLQNRPDLVSQLRQRFIQSGMTPDQVRARLRAEGYPEDLLDPYLSSGSASASDSMPGENIFSAVESLGITDDADLDSLRLRAGLTPSRRALGAAGSARNGRTTARDSLYPRAAEPEPRPPVRRKPAQGVFDLRLPDTTKLAGLPKAVRDSILRADSIAVADTTDQLAVFGLSMFADGTSQFDPNTAGPVDANYRLGPGDRLVLVLTGDVEAAYNLDVTRQGFVVIPSVGEVNVSNLTLAQLEDVLYARLGRVYSGLHRGAGATTHFSVSPSRLRSNQVYVIGDVAQPGSYRISATGTALTALYAAAGPTEIGSLRRIEVRRGGRVVDQLDLYDYLLRGDASHDPRLENGDVVFVPPHGARVELHGEVLRPAIYEMKPGETIAELVAAAGGFTPQADRHRVQVDRILPAAQRTGAGNARIVLDVAGASDSASRVAMVDGDVVHVYPVSDRVRSVVRVGGNVWSPGAVGFAPGMTLSEALRRAGGLKPDSYLGEVLVSRLRGDSTRVQLRTALLDTTGRASDDIALRDDDEIQVFSLSDFRPLRYVALSGAVKRPGRYPYREGMTMRDLVLMAGGVKESAWLREAEIARLPETREGGKLAQTVRVPLDSSYVLDRSPEATYAGSPYGIVQAGRAAEVALQPYDNVLIMQAPDWSAPRTVALTGEVKYPGTYTLTSKGERLSDVVQRAGGLTGDGYADGVVFYRKRNKTGRIGVDLASVLRHPGAPDDIALQDGDSIYVPIMSGVVTVDGGVNSPTTVAWVPGANIDYYIAAAGGLSPTAELGRAYVTQPNGKVESRHTRFLLPDSKPTPRAGSKVFVPLQDPSEKHDYAAAVQIAGSLASLVASLMAAIAISRRN